MSDTLPSALGYCELVIFFVFDAVYAHTLRVLKQAHPELDECAPEHLPDVDTTVLLDCAAAASSAVAQRLRQLQEQQQQQRYHNVAGGSDNNDWHTTAAAARREGNNDGDGGDVYAARATTTAAATGLRDEVDDSHNNAAAAAAVAGYAPLRPPHAARGDSGSGNYNNDGSSRRRSNGELYATSAADGAAAMTSSYDALRHPLHMLAVVCSVAGPVLLLLQLLLPGMLAWTRVHVPVWLSYLFVVPGMAATGLYVMRVTSSSSSSYGSRGGGGSGAVAVVPVLLADVTKTQWLAMTWFRIDFVFLLAAVALFGLGLWLVACCMVVAAAYTTHRVMHMERQLQRVQKHTRLVREDVDVAAVLVPGTAESRRAAGAQDGYSALAAPVAAAAV